MAEEEEAAEAAAGDEQGPSYDPRLHCLGLECRHCHDINDSGRCLAKKKTGAMHFSMCLHHGSLPSWYLPQRESEPRRGSYRRVAWGFSGELFS